MRAGDDTGASLVETITAVSIMGLTVVGIVGALGSALMNTHAEKRLTTADGVAVSYTEMVRSSRSYVPCASPSDYSPAAIGWTVPSGFVAEVSAVELWDGVADPAGFAPVPAGCTALSDPGAQRLVIEVRPSSGGGSSRTVEMVWRRQ